MTCGLHSIAYLSRNVCAGDLAQTVAEIVEVSRTRNADNGITGALVCSPHYFAQVLEGDLDKLEETLERVLLDPRHRDVQVLFSRPIATREFGGWGMVPAGTVEDETMVAAVRDALGGSAPPEVLGVAGDRAVALMKRLLRERQARRETEGDGAGPSPESS